MICYNYIQLLRSSGVSLRGKSSICSHYFLSTNVMMMATTTNAHVI